MRAGHVDDVDVRVEALLLVGAVGARRGAAAGCGVLGGEGLRGLQASRSDGRQHAAGHQGEVAGDGVGDLAGGQEPQRGRARDRGSGWVGGEVGGRGDDMAPNPPAGAPGAPE